MKKINKIMFLLISIILFASSNKVNALYNGSAGTSFSGSGGGSCGSLKNCTYGNPGKIFMQARLYYIENGSFTQIGKTFYFVNSSAYDYLKNTELKNQIISINASSYQDMRNKLNSYFLSNNAITNNGKAFLNKVTNSDDYTKILKKDSQAANKNTPATKGYRIVIEPALLYANPTFSSDGRALMTVKGMAGEARRIHTGSGTNGSGTYSYNGYDMPSCTGKPGANANCSYPLLGLGAQAQYLFTEFRDVGISGASKSYCENVNTDQLADMKNGCGLNMIDITKYSTPTCYVSRVLSTQLACEKYNQNNTKSFSETYVKCSGNQKSNNQYNIYGKKISESGTCKIYCKESAFVSLPGNISESIRQGSFFEWPTLPDNSEGLFKMSMKSSFKCTIIDESGAQTVAPTYTRQCPSNSKEINIDQCRENNPTRDGNCPNNSTSNGQTSNTCSTVASTTTRHCPTNTSKSINSTQCRKFSGYTCSGNGKQSTSDQSLCVISKVKSYSCKEGNLEGDKCYISYKSVPKCDKGTYNSNYNLCVTGTTTNYICPDGTHSSTGRCYAKIETYYTCPSGYTSRSGSTCYKSHAPGVSCTGVWSFYNSYTCKASVYTNYRCPRGYPNDAYNGYCYAYATDRKCKDGWNYRYDLGSCVKGPSYRKGCESGWTENPTQRRCYKAASSSLVCPDGSGWHSKNSTECVRSAEKVYNGAIEEKICSSPYKKCNNGCCTYKNVNKICSSNEDLINGKCYKQVSKLSVGDPICPTGYTPNDDKTTCVNNCDKNKLKENAKNVLKKIELKATLTAGTNSIINEELVVAKEDTKFDDNEMSYSKIVYFKIKDNRNRYFNKITRQVTDTAQKNNINILDRGSGVISLKPTDYGENFELKISNVKIGKDNIFGQYVNGYTCHYNVTSEDNNSCKCPAGTINSGAYVNDIYGLISCNNKPSEPLTTCVDKQEKVCNLTEPVFNKIMQGCGVTCMNRHNVYITDCVKKNFNMGFTEAVKYCTYNTAACKNGVGDGDETDKKCVRVSDNKEVSMKSCLDQGNSEKYCRESLGCTNSTNKCYGTCSSKTETKSGLTLKYKLCNTSNYCSSDFSCSNSNEKLTKDAEYCFLKEIGENSMENALKKYAGNRAKIQSVLAKCKPVSCLSDVNKAIFRIIDLNDPFPANTKIKYTGFSNNNKDSRKPGANWNSKDVVSKYILNARDSKGYALYSKEPLYRITLTPDIIKKIREYNSKNNYNNFNLKCMNNKKDAACMSEFLHNSNKSISKQIITGGKCRSISFDEKGFNSCYQK